MTGAGLWMLIIARSSRLQGGALRDADDACCGEIQRQQLSLASREEGANLRCWGLAKERCLTDGRTDAFPFSQGRNLSAFW